MKAEIAQLAMLSGLHCVSTCKAGTAVEVEDVAPADKIVRLPVSNPDAVRRRLEA